jgi:hypothetical protein
MPIPQGAAPTGVMLYLRVLKAGKQPAAETLRTRRPRLHRVATRRSLPLPLRGLEWPLMRISRREPIYRWSSGSRH